VLPPPTVPALHRVPSTAAADLKRSPRSGGRWLPILLGIGAGLLVAAWIVYIHLTATPSQRLVDLAVYRDGGRSVLLGRAIYSHVTPPPQLLPFTYPPFAALLAVPLAWLPMGLDGYLWTAGELACTAVISWFAFRRLLPRFGRWAPVALGVLAGAMQWMLPFGDEIKFGQVDELLVVLVLLDCLTARPRWPRGLLIGLATAIKLTPGVFIVYLWLTGRRRAAGVAAATTVGVTLLTAAILPRDSAAFWLHAVLQPERTGLNSGEANQSLRGILLRLSWPHGPTVVVWLLAVAVVALLGFRRAVRASRAGDELAGVALVGLLAVLLSPVAWIHHLAWLPLVIGIIAADGRDRRRIMAAFAVWLCFFAKLPWWGAHMLARHGGPAVEIFLLRNAYGLIALGLVLFLPWRRRDPLAPPYPLSNVPRAESLSTAD